MTESMFIAGGKSPVYLIPSMACRHGLVSGATGTGKTASLQVLAENFSLLGVPVFMADVKGDLSGMAQEGVKSPAVMKRLESIGIDDFETMAFPVTFWDIYGKKGHPVRTTISEMGPLLLSRLLGLNPTQEGNLTIIFRIADDNGLLLLDLKDLKAMLKFAGDNASELSSEYGRISGASIGTIQRKLLMLEEQGVASLFGEPALNLDDLIQTDEEGRGVINILSADRLISSPAVYSTFLLWMLSELFENLEEVGDLDKPRLVFFFDEAHLLFKDAPKALLDKIEQVVRLIRSKGVAVFFVTQSPADIPQQVLGQLGNRLQHALRAFTPKDQKAVRAIAETFRDNPEINEEDVLMNLSVGEALISFLNPDGSPGVVQRALVAPPKSRMGPVDEGERRRIINNSVIYGHYENEIDRESAYEVLAKRAENTETTVMKQKPAPVAKKTPVEKKPVEKPGIFDAFAKSAVRSFGSSLGRQLFRGTLGSLFGGKKR